MRELNFIRRKTIVGMNQPDQNQHRIPQVYLRQWSFKDKRNADTLCVMKKGDPVSHYKTVKNFTAEKNLFDTTLYDEGFERFFDEKCKYVETNFPKIITSLQMNDYSGQIRIYLTEFMSNLFVRQRSTFEFLMSIVPRIHLREKLLYELAILEQENPNLIKAVYEEMSIDPDHSIDSKVSAVILQAWKHFNKVFDRFNHVILKAPADRYWCTSDNPVYTTNFGKDGWLVGAETEAYFPVSKEYLAYMYVDGIQTDNLLTKLQEDTVAEIPLEVFDDIMYNVILNSNSDYFVHGEDIGNYNAKTDEFQNRYKPVDPLEPHLLRKDISLMDTPFPPELNDQDLEKLLNKMDAEFEPIEVPVETHPLAVENECVAIVDQAVLQNGGKRILGWQIWKGPYLIEAEFHAVWETPEESLKDISFKKNMAQKIIFVEDSRLVYSRRQINNIRMSLIRSSLVDDFIELCNQQFRLMNKGKRTDLYGQDLWNSLTDAQRKNLDDVARLRQLVWGLLDAGGNENSGCPCNSGRKYKNCHGTRLKELSRLD